MIGFKTSDDFSFDECIAFLSEHNNADSSWNEINQRYHHLLTQLHKEDESAFSMCRTTIDYNNYLNRFKNISGASKYQPIHKVEAEEFIKKNPIPHPTPTKGFFASFFYDAKKRNSITNLVLYILLFASFIATIVQIPNVIWSYGLYNDDGWSFSEVYGKGFIPGLLICVFAFFGVSKIIKWRRSGLTILVASFIIILLPTVCNEFLEFIFFSVPCMLGIALLWGALKIKKDGVSTWEMCQSEPRWANFILRSTLLFWIFSVILLPPMVGLWTGFRSNVYSNGMRCLDAHFNNSSYYSYDLYQKILLGSDFKDDTYEKKTIAESWLANAKYLDSLEGDEDYRLDDELSEPMLFLNNLIFILNNESSQDAFEYIDYMKSKIDISSVFKYLDGEKYVMGEYDYYKPNKERITSILNQADIYEEVVEADIYEEAVEATPYDGEAAE